MSSRAHKLTFVALLLAILFVAAQFHQCADLTANNSSTNVCPVCSTAATVVVPESPVIAVVSTEAAFVAAPEPRVISSPIPNAASPRASPAV
jgi:hypothetical protein